MGKIWLFLIPTVYYISKYRIIISRRVFKFCVYRNGDIQVGAIHYDIPDRAFGSRRFAAKNFYFNVIIKEDFRDLFLFHFAVSGRHHFMAGWQVNP
ncbi:MAG: hypothetical protein QG657_470 [Acidobacteriota bacterium]|nr:hypothetical protein [Acidobacteriota bacterium]